MDRNESSLFRSIKSLALITVLLAFIVFQVPRAEAEVLLGPEVSVSLPQTLQLGVEGYCTEGPFFCTDRFREYVDLGGVLYPLAVSDKLLSVFSLETGVRYFPTNAFFVGMSLGIRNIGLKADLSAFKIDGAELATSAAVNFFTIYTGPFVGVKFGLGNGFLLEANAGIQLPLYASGSMYFVDGNTGNNSNNSSTLQVDSTSAMTRIARILLPSITVLRLIRYF